MNTLPTGSAERKDVPLARGCLDYFPAALAAVAKLSRAGNEKHNPGEELHHARGKSMDHADCIVRHLVDRGTVDPEDGIPHSVKVAWRALALLQEELEASGSPLARGARLPDPEKQPPPNENWCVGCTPDEEIYPGTACCGCPPDKPFGIETDPKGQKYRRTGERRPPLNGEHYLNENDYDLGAVCQSIFNWQDLHRTIVEPVE
jgi:hypothetical protein